MPVAEYWYLVSYYTGIYMILITLYWTHCGYKRHDIDAKRVRISNLLYNQPPEMSNNHTLDHEVKRNASICVYAHYIEQQFL